MTAPTLDTDLTAATDAELDAGLVRLYRKHYDADLGGKRDGYHAGIMEILSVQQQRLDVWLAER